MNEGHELTRQVPEIPAQWDLTSDAAALCNALGITGAAATPFIGARLARRLTACVACGQAVGSERVFEGCCGATCVEKQHGKRGLMRFYKQEKARAA